MDMQFDPRLDPNEMSMLLLGKPIPFLADMLNTVEMANQMPVYEQLWRSNQENARLRLLLAKVEDRLKVSLADVQQIAEAK